jgi:outer membrane protein TolC
MREARRSKPLLVATLVVAVAVRAGSGAGQPVDAANVLRIDLPAALRLADERNLDVAIYVERVAEASAKLAQARTLAVPTLRVGGSANRHTGTLQETSGTSSTRTASRASAASVPAPWAPASWPRRVYR